MSDYCLVVAVSNPASIDPLVRMGSALARANNGPLIITSVTEIPPHIPVTTDDKLASQQEAIIDLEFLPADTLSLRILRSDDSILVDLFSDQNSSFTRYHTKYEADDGDTSLEYVRRRRAGGEPLIRRLREVIHDTLARELPELAVPTPGTDLVAVVVQHRKHGR